jgi:hypothetical protein
MTKPPKYPLTSETEAPRTTKHETPSWLNLVPSFKFAHELPQRERPYDYYEAHPEFRPRRLSKRLLRRRLIRGD